MPVRARDVRSNIQSMGFERGMAHTLELLCEEHVAVLQQLVSLAEIQNAMIDRMNEFMTIGERIQEKVDQLRRDQRTGDQLDGDKV